MRWWVTLGLAIGLGSLFGFAYQTLRSDLDQAGTDQAVRAARSEADWLALLLVKQLEENARALEVVAQGSSEGATALALRSQKTGSSAKAWVIAMRSQLGTRAEVALVDDGGVVQEASEGGSSLGRPKAVTRALQGRATIGVHRFGTLRALVAASPVPGARGVAGAVVVAIPLEASMLRRWVPGLPEGAGLALLDDQGVVAHTLSVKAGWPSKLKLTDDGRYVSERSTRFGTLRVQTIATLIPPGRPSMGSRAAVWVLWLGILAFVVAAAVVWLVPLGPWGVADRTKTLDLLKSVSMPPHVPPVHVPDLAGAAKPPAVQPLPVPPARSSTAKTTSPVENDADPAFQDSVTPVREVRTPRASTRSNADPYDHATVPAPSVPPEDHYAQATVHASRTPLLQQGDDGSELPDSTPPPDVASRFSDSAPDPIADLAEELAGRSPVEASLSAAGSATDDLIAQIRPPDGPSPPTRTPLPAPTPPGRREPDLFDAIASAARARPKSPPAAGPSSIPSSVDSMSADGFLGSSALPEGTRPTDLPAPRMDLPAPTTIPPELRGRSAGTELPESWDAPSPRAPPVPPPLPEDPESVPLPAPVGYKADLLAPKDVSAVPLPPARSSTSDPWLNHSVPPGAVAPKDISAVRGSRSVPGGSSSHPPTPIPPLPNGQGSVRSESVPLPPGPAPSGSSRPVMDSGSLSPAGGIMTTFDEEHYRAVYDRFVKAKTDLGQTPGNVSWEAFRGKLRSSERSLLDQHGCRAVRFQVLVRDRTVSLRPQLIR